MTVILNRLTKNVLNIVINRPAKRNAIDLETCVALQAALKSFEEDDCFKVAILSGAAGSFSSGYDLNELLGQNNMIDVSQLEQLMWPLKRRLTDSKVTIAAIDGHAAGFGLELALKCDFRVAEKDARLGFLNRRFAIPIMNGGSVILPQLVGEGRSRELIATGKAQLAAEALESGLVNYVTDIGCSLGRSLNLARCLSKFNQAALLHDLKSLDQYHEHNLSQKLHTERQRSVDYLRQTSTPFHLVRRFLEGDLFRHGNTDMGNLADSSKTRVTL